jgi:alkanesulfonate monooxygenase SsuD/methylene tetrahydromethanopterin reductase-like flavin-dependent oxidoreductase (luciferase family)
MHYTISLHYRSRDTAYRDAFRPNTISETPYFAIAAFGAVGDDEAEALQHWHAHGAGDRRSEASTGPSFSGSATTVGSRDRPAVESYGADEILLDCFAGSLDARLECLHRLADALGLLSSPNANQPR